ncbi:MAG TPA: 6-bladed beta-propeller [Nitrospirae bacterium]|nr:6-bladed beta-propeller [Nitrospirota bacterium]HDK17226.1 6-bladed beta-propeller [Nitrospirota bacterium]HDK41464.1 6-bladed beta-propeller [Nitrospirota bacterium]
MLTIRLTNVKHLFDIKHNFSQPSDVAVSPDGSIYVVDGVNNRIKVFDNKGGFVFSFGGKGSGRGEFRAPLGIDINDSGWVYIAGLRQSQGADIQPAGELHFSDQAPQRPGPGRPDRCRG